MYFVFNLLSQQLLDIMVPVTPIQLYLEDLEGK